MTPKAICDLRFAICDFVLSSNIKLKFQLPFFRQIEQNAAAREIVQIFFVQ